MSKNPDLFTEMDRIADSIRENNPDLRAALRDELWQEFKELQQRRMPQLSEEERLDLFETWLLRDLSRLKAAHDAALNDIRATIEQAVVRNGEPPPLICRCGTYIINPFDDETIAEHAPHMRGHWA